MSHPYLLLVALSLAALHHLPASAAESPTKAQATEALHTAVDFFRTEAGVQGGYVYLVSDDLARREGENRVGPWEVWIQPPGTPAVGSAYLTAYQLTGDAKCLDAARETADCLIRGQLRSGCWAESIEFDPKLRPKHAYRVESTQSDKQRNTSTLDDDKSQSCVRFLMRLDEATKFKDARLHEAARFALDCLAAVQYPNGAWPQRFSVPPDPAKFPVKQASYPESWSRTWPAADYQSHYTFNDDTIADTIGVMLEAADIYNEPRYRAAAEKAGGFILLSQMPQPQPAWAQQYDADMHPSWARKFEPPAITGGETRGIVRILIELARRTGDKKYLAPIPAALAWLKQSQLGEGKLARFYELHTNQPLYFTKKYELTYERDDLPTHYGFIIQANLAELAAEYERALAADKPQIPSRQKKPPKMSDALAKQANSVISHLDSRGAWVTDGKLRTWGDDDPTRRVIDSRVFIKNLETLGQFIAAMR